MTVSELIELLQKEEPDMIVKCYSGSYFTGNIRIEINTLGEIPCMRISGIDNEELVSAKGESKDGSL
jgi:hypothetical protein